MAKLLLGKEVTDALNASLQTRTAALREKGTVPTLGIIRVGANPSDLSYEKGAVKRAELVGVEVKKFELPEDASKEDVLAVIDQVNADDSIHGVLMFRPLPKHLKADQDEICNTLDPKKDMDCMTVCLKAGIWATPPAPPRPAWRFWTTTASTARARTPWSSAGVWW